MQEKRIWAAVLAVMVMIIFSSTAARADQTDKLIKILIDKGIITKDEAKSLEEEVKGNAPVKEVKKEAAPGEDWTKKIEVGYNKGAYIKTPDDRYSLKLNVRTCTSSSRCEPPWRSRPRLICLCGTHAGSFWSSPRGRKFGAAKTTPSRHTTRIRMTCQRGIWTIVQAYAERLGGAVTSATRSGRKATFSSS